MGNPSGFCFESNRYLRNIQTNGMIERIRTFIQANNIPQPPFTAIAGLSGGADSVVMTHVLTRLGYDVVPVHCNFHLRGVESDRDEQFVSDLCDKWGLQPRIIGFDTLSHAKNKGISVEMAARELRYAYFEEIRSQYGNAAIFVAHHSDDSIETMLLNLIRGTGLAGLCGIKAVNGHIMRPLLCISRDDIENYAKENGLPYVTDSTNMQNDYMRNKIRNKLIPLLKEINPDVIKVLLTDIENFSGAYDIYKASTEKQLREILQSDGKVSRLDVSKLSEVPDKETLLHEWLKKHGFNPSQTKQIASCKNAENGTAFQSRSHVLRKEGGFWTLYEKEPGSEPGSISINDILKIEETNDTTIIKSKDTAVFDASKLQFPLSVRKWQEGDRFHPIGMAGKTKKVSDLLCDLKMPVREKDKVLVLLSCGQIAWVIGIRPDERFKVTQSTKRVIKATIKPPRDS